MAPELQWALGLIVAVVGLVGGIIARDRYILRMINTETQAVRASAKEDADKLHERLNRVRDDYVRRSDMNEHISRLESSLKELTGFVHESNRQTNARLDALISHLTTNS